MSNVITSVRIAYHQGTQFEDSPQFMEGRPAPTACRTHRPVSLLILEGPSYFKTTGFTNSGKTPGGVLL